MANTFRCATYRMDDETLNLGFSIAIEWGADWLKPIQSRLKTARPDLSQSQRKECNKIVQSAMTLGHQLVPEFLAANLESDFDGWVAAIRQHYPWISDDNLNRCFSQGVYYTMQ